MPAQPPFPGVKPNASAQDPRVRDEADRRDRRRGEELAQRCGELEESLEQLRTRYELYFLGVERREPARDREEMRRAVARLKGEANVATGLRFRIETLHARFLSYDRMWTRTARQKEEGTYRRDIQRGRRRQQRQAEAARRAASPGEPPAASALTAAAGAAAEAASAGAPQGEQRATAPPTRAASASPTPSPTSGAPPLPPGVTAEQLRALHAAYVEAKRSCREDVSRITYDALARTVARQVPELLARHKARSVEFKVVVKDGRALLKAIPRS